MTDGESSDSFVCKPVEFGAFADAIRQLGLYWLVVDETAPTGRMPQDWWPDDPGNTTAAHPTLVCHRGWTIVFDARGSVVHGIGGNA